MLIFVKFLRNIILFWPKQLRTVFVCFMCVFPEGGAVGQSVEDRRKKMTELQAVFRETGFPFHILPLEQVSVDSGGPC